MPRAQTSLRSWPPLVREGCLQPRAAWPGPRPGSRLALTCPPRPPKCWGWGQLRRLSHSQVGLPEAPGDVLCPWPSVEIQSEALGCPSGPVPFQRLPVALPAPLPLNALTGFLGWSHCRQCLERKSYHSSFGKRPKKREKNVASPKADYIVLGWKQVKIKPVSNSLPRKLAAD